MESVVDRSRVWSAVGRDDAFVHWREVVCQAFTRLSPERLDGRLGDGPFAGDIRAVPLGRGGSLSRITASPQIVLRRREDVAERPCDAVFVNIQIAGTSVVRQREIETRLVPGSFALLDARQPFAMRFEGPFRQICLHVPIAWLDRHGIDPARAVARRLDRGEVYAAALVDHAIATLQGEDAGTGDETGDAEHLMHLLGLCYADGRADTLADRHLAHIRRFVLHNCADARMSPAAVAGRFRISVRYVHRLFARSGESFGQYLLRCRLHRARRALLLAGDRPILEVALEAGFQDPSHFARSFRRRYGMTPSTLRRLAATRDCAAV
ncbi:helix-turn-helix domain-containing protein [Microbaculum marinum]|uniref:Helix-turn-helix domain-containing protein n=1 Tax=Microbaculum marinum TaxID=1764581 RepID=A0AAW9RD07_9HYPH